MINQNKKLIIGLFCLSFLYFLVRLFNLTTLPVFGDEAIYIRWAQIIQSMDTMRFIPLSDGKQPLFMWLLALYIKYLSDPLVAGRLLSVFAGWGTMICLFFTPFLIFNLKKFTPISIIVCLLYIFTPYTFFFDRLALTDSLLCFWLILSFLLTLLLIKFPRFDLSFLLGGVLGLAWLTKSPAIYFIFLSFATFFFFHFKKPANLVFPFVSVFLTFLIYHVLWLGPQFHQIALRNRDYVHPLSEILRHPLDPFLSHFKSALSLFTAYFSLSLLPLLLYLKKNYRSYRLLLPLCWFLLPFLVNLGLAKVFTGRYLLFTLPFLLILIAHPLSKLSHKYLITSLLLLPSLFSLYQLSTNPFHFSPPQSELGYFQDWTSGWGIKASADFLISQSQTRPITVATEGFFGTLPDGLQIYTHPYSSLKVEGVGLNLSQPPAYNYYLGNQSRITFPYHQPQIVLQFPKPNGDTLLLLNFD